MAGLTITGLTVEYSSGGYTARPLDGFDAHIAPGALALLLGPSGCGKTTLLSCVAGILSPTSGSIRTGDIEVTTLSGAALTEYRRRHVGVVFQAFNLIPSLDATENVMVPLRAAGISRKAARARAVDLLGQVDLAHRIDHRPGALSGGQQQRVAIARALALDPPLVLADEPTAHLDYIQVEGVLRILRRLADGGRTIAISTHDERLLPLADQVVELAPRGRPPARPPELLDVAAGETVFRQGSRAELIFVIEDGEIEIVRELDHGGEEPIVRLVAGQHFGEIGPLFGLARSATARARTDARLLAYTAAAFGDAVGPQRLAEVIRGAGVPVSGGAPRIDAPSTGGAGSP